MNSTICVKLGFLLILVVGLTAAKCEKDQNFRFVLEKMPHEYRTCAAKIVPQINGTGRVTQADLVRYAATLKTYGHSQNRCLRGAIAWSDAQVSAYQKHF